ncbi:ECF transporter S component [Agromyces protaetiae]|uniref:ECF transporter S component n=1 Tax=Agromyces protaetiae TaxID=2509455 RepID=UPI0013EAA863|nr:ECF transporter S component [Agromyces protaetiae]
MKVPTRILLTCAAIGAAGGVLLVPVNLVSSVLAPTVPLAYAAIAGVYSLPFVLVLALLRRPGVALLAGLIAGIINAILTPQGPSAIITCLMVAFFLEIPFAIGLYRSWRAWIFYVGAGVFALVYALYSMLRAGGEAWPWWMQLGYPVLCVASNLAAVWLGRLIAARLEAAGLARGLRPARDGVTGAPSASSDAPAEAAPAD